jgi:hypothetical protein
MFVQVIEGQVADRQRLRQQLEQWNEQLRPAASGFLGSTAGVSDDGRAIVLARFESADAATANSARPEQDSWWSDTATCFDGEVTFQDSEDVEEYLGGGSDDAGFVQVMKYHGVDRARFTELDADFEQFASFRPDLLGGIRVWTGPDSAIEAAYFTTEAEAREGEKKQPPAELADQLAEFESVMANTEFIDLREPLLY